MNISSILSTVAMAKNGSVSQEPWDDLLGPSLADDATSMGLAKRLLWE